MPAMRVRDRLLIPAIAVVMLEIYAPAFAGGREAPAWPQAWFEPAPKASEVGLTSFTQSPVLDGKGLPPVAERLPDDPVVVTPLGEPGVGQP